MNKKEMLSFFAIIVIVGLGIARTGAENIPSASNLLDRYTQALDSTKSFIEHHEARVNYSSRFAGVQDSGEKIAFGQVRHDDQRIYFQQYTWGDFNRKNKNLPKDKPYYRCNIANGRDKKVYQHNRWINDSENSGSAGRQPYLREMKVNLSRYFGVSYIVGYIGSDERLDAVLRKADRISVRETTENIGGSECFVIEADTKYGRYTVWLDPEHSFHTAKVLHKAERGDYAFSHQLSNGESATTYVDNVSFEKVDGLWAPIGAEAGSYGSAANGDFIKEEYHYKRKQIILNPDHDKLGSFADPLSEDPNNDPELRNGTRVRLNNMPIQYMWQDGKLIPDIDKTIIEDLERVAKEIKNSKTVSDTNNPPYKETELKAIIEVLGKYRATQDKLQSFVAKGESVITTVSETSPSNMEEKEICEFCFDGSRVSHRRTSWDGKITTKEKPGTTRFLFDGVRLIQYRKAQNPENNLVFVSKDTAGENKITATEYEGSALMGFLAGDSDRIDLILSRAKDISRSDKAEQISGSDCIAVEASVKNNKYRIWFDTQHGYNIAKAEVENGDKEDKTSFSLLNVRFEKIDNVWVSMEADMELKEDHGNNITRVHHKRTEMTLKPDHDTLKSFSTDEIPDGTKVVFPELYDNLEYIWQDGRPAEKGDSYNVK